MNELINCRKAFEDWYALTPDCPSLKRSGDSYALMQAHQAWVAFSNGWIRKPSAAPAVAPDLVSIKADAVKHVHTSDIVRHRQNVEAVIDHLHARGYLAGQGDERKSHDENTTTDRNANAGRCSESGKSGCAEGLAATESLHRCDATGHPENSASNHDEADDGPLETFNPDWKCKPDCVAHGVMKEWMQHGHVPPDVVERVAELSAGLDRLCLVIESAVRYQERTDSQNYKDVLRLLQSNIATNILLAPYRRGER